MSFSSGLGPGILKLLEINAKFNPDGIPNEMKKYDQWVTWSSIEHDSNGQPTKAKIPVYVKGNQLRRSKWNSPEYQLSFEEALENWENSDLIHGVGFVFSSRDPFVFIDFDKMEENDQRYQYVDGTTFTEVSQSGKGLHLIVKGHLTKAHKPTTGEVEMYYANRFCAMTGDLFESSTTEIAEDQGLIEKLRSDFPYEKSRTKAKFELPEKVGKGSRDNTMHAYCWSLFSKGCSYEQALALAEQANETRFEPPLDDEVVRDKIDRAFEGINEDQRSVEKMAERFVFVNSCNRYYDTKTNTSMSKEALNTSFKFEFPGGPGQRPLLSNVLSSSPSFEIVNDFVWMPAPFGKDMKIVDYDGAKLVNTWKGFSSIPLKGDVSSWLQLGKHLCGDDSTLKVVLERLAYDIQFPHKKCNWGLVFHGIQGAGKDLFLTPISRIFGSAYSTIGNKDIKSDYDDGFVKTKVVVVNEVRNLRGDALESLKQKTASESNVLSLLNPKKEHKILHPNLWSIIMNTNHPDALKFDKHERRFYVIECKKSMEGIKEADEIIDEIVNNDQFANYVMEYLMSIDLSNFNPGVVKERTKAFYEMIDITEDDLETTLSDMFEQGEGSFQYDFVTPDMLMKDLIIRDVNYSKKAIKIWLKKNGWEKFDRKIQKKKGNSVQTKSRLYHAKKGSEWLVSETSDVFDSIDQQEKMISIADKERFSSKTR